jgi:hypothetical protein
MFQFNAVGAVLTPQVLITPDTTQNSTNTPRQETKQNNVSAVGIMQYKRSSGVNPNHETKQHNKVV